MPVSYVYVGLYLLCFTCDANTEVVRDKLSHTRHLFQERLTDHFNLQTRTLQPQLLSHIALITNQDKRRFHLFTNTPTLFDHIQCRTIEFHRTIHS